MKRNTTFKDERTLTERRHQKAIDALQRAEEQLNKALTRWQKARNTLKRYDKRADKQLARQTHWPTLQRSADQIKDPDDNLNSLATD